METQSLKQTYFKNEDYHLEYQVVGLCANIHCTVYNWKPSALKHGYNIFGKMLNEFADKGLEYVITISPNPRFCELMGGELSHTVDYNGEVYGVYKWELK